MIEVAMVFDLDGKIIHWHEPPNRSGGSIPDSRSLWEVLWENRDRLGGVAHTHPWNGVPGPSQTDVTTWAACEAALGKRLVWPIVTFTQEVHFIWCGPGTHDYRGLSSPDIRVDGVDELREKSRVQPTNKPEGVHHGR